MSQDRLWFLLLVLVASLGLTAVSQAESKGKVLYSFVGGSDGANPASPLIFDKTGNLYGTTESGGAKSCGTVFELTPSGRRWTEKVIYSFSYADGCEPNAVIFDKSGNLYGSTSSGGANGVGAVFELSPSNGIWIESVLYSFAGGKDGTNPTSALAFDKKGKLYGTTSTGGKLEDCYPDGCGTVFMLAKSNGVWAKSTIYKFQGLDGADPTSGSLIFDPSGNLFGATQRGGPNEAGNVFELGHAGGKWTESVLYTFDGQQNGAVPEGGVVFDPQGHLYGVTIYADNDAACPNCQLLNTGTVFELSSSNNGWVITTLYAFQGGSDGLTPLAGLTLDKNGNFYGTTTAGGNSERCHLGCGTVFKVSPSGGTWSESVLYTFRLTQGAFPQAPLTLHNGTLFGTTSEGGSSGNGVVFSLKP